MATRVLPTRVPVTILSEGATKAQIAARLGVRDYPSDALIRFARIRPFLHALTPMGVDCSKKAIVLGDILNSVTIVGETERRFIRAHLDSFLQTCGKLDSLVAVAEASIKAVDRPKLRKLWGEDL